MLASPPGSHGCPCRHRPRSRRPRPAGPATSPCAAGPRAHGPIRPESQSNTGRSKRGPHPESAEGARHHSLIGQAHPVPKKKNALNGDEGLRTEPLTSTRRMRNSTSSSPVTEAIRVWAAARSVLSHACMDMRIKETARRRPAAHSHPGGRAASRLPANATGRGGAPPVALSGYLRHRR